jgi:hypothetical protein
MQLVAKEALANDKLQQMLQDQREAEKSKERTLTLQKEVCAQHFPGLFALAF